MISIPFNLISEKDVTPILKRRKKLYSRYFVESENGEFLLLYTIFREEVQAQFLLIDEAAMWQGIIRQIF